MANPTSFVIDPFFITINASLFGAYETLFHNSETVLTSVESLLNSQKDINALSSFSFGYKYVIDNKLLYLNLRKIKSIVLLDDVCDSPDFYNWGPSIGEREIPLVVYEVLEDYIYDSEENDEIAEDEYSTKFRKLLYNLIEERKRADILCIRWLAGIRIRYADGSVVENDIEAGASTGYGLWRILLRL